MMIVVSGCEVLTGVSTSVAMVTVASDGHLDNMSKFFCHMKYSIDLVVSFLQFH